MIIIDSKKGTLTKTLMGLFIPIFFLFAIYPDQASANIFSSIGSLFKDSKVGAMGATENSQNMAILEAPLNTNPTALYNKTDIIIEDSTALVSEHGPSGSSADVSVIKSFGQISVYIVKNGDSISTIAKLHDVSVNTVLWANNLTKTSILKEGQTLVILPISGVNHKVAKDETLSGIIAKYKADMDEVLSYNDLTINSKLKVGQEIIIPDVDVAEPASSGIANNGSSRYLGGGGPNYVGYYIRPLKGGVKTQSLHGWNAVDLAAPIGTPIYASASGEVVISSSNGSWNKGYGNYVVINHKNGTQTIYGHTSKNLVSVGDIVEQGEPIALVGSTGKSTGPHLHFEVRGGKNPF